MTYAISIMCIIAAVLTWLEGMASHRASDAKCFAVALAYMVAGYAMWLRPWEAMQ